MGATPHTTQDVKSVLPRDDSIGPVSLGSSEDDNDIEKAVSRPSSSGAGSVEKEQDSRRTSIETASTFEPLISPRTPFIHFDLESAVRAATADARS